MTLGLRAVLILAALAVFNLAILAAHHGLDHTIAPIVKALGA